MNDTKKSDVSEKRPYLKQRHSPHDAPRRRSLPHDPPHFIGTADAVFFITVSSQPKGTNQLCKPDVAEAVYRSVQHYHAKHFWSVPILLLMPDHLHLLAKFSPEGGMKKLIRNWKRYLANESGIIWQRDFFDHRLRSDESLSNKAAYILQNPVRAGLINQSEDWPYQFRLV
jgi:putative transposase